MPLLLALCLLAAPAPKALPPSRIAPINGVPTLHVAGAPFFVLGAQCDIWRSTRQDAATEAFFDGYQAMHATTVSVGIPWSKVETEEGKFDFAFIDWFIRAAEKRGLRLVLNLFCTNVCGKVAEMAPGGGYFPQYAPDWMLKQPDRYQRMALPSTWRYAGGGPPMCPNDPDTLARERRLAATVARHLREKDLRRTVVMLQVDNEYYYQQWEGPAPAYGSPEYKAVRCRCSLCDAKWASGTWPSAEAFMFEGLADYAASVAEAITAEYAIPVYLNSPWWSPETVATFLRRAPKVALVGIDGAFTTVEPNVLVQCQVGRNTVFAAENPTEQPQTRMNLDVLPYYTLIGAMGIGNLLWEAGPPRTVVEDPEARARYGRALLPLRNAMEPIARARGTERLLGWCAVREPAPDAREDAHGNPIPGPSGAPAVRTEQIRIREGRSLRMVPSGRFEAALAGLRVTVEGASAGVLLRTGPRSVVAALPAGRVTLHGLGGKVRAEAGRFDGARWVRSGKHPVAQAGADATVDAAEAGVVRVSW